MREARLERLSSQQSQGTEKGIGGYASSNWKDVRLDMKNVAAETGHFEVELES